MSTYLIVDDEAYWRTAVSLALTRTCMKHDKDQIFTAATEDEARQKLEEIDDQLAIDKQKEIDKLVEIARQEATAKQQAFIEVDARREARRKIEEQDIPHLMAPIVFIDVVFPHDDDAFHQICVQTKLNRRYAIPIIMTANPAAPKFRSAINSGSGGFIAKTDDAAIFEAQVWAMAERAIAMQKQLKAHEIAIRKLLNTPEHRSHPNLQDAVNGVRKAFEHSTCDYGDIDWL